jgi:hypothetical protein
MTSIKGRCPGAGDRRGILEATQDKIEILAHPQPGVPWAGAPDDVKGEEHRDVATVELSQQAGKGDVAAELRRDSVLRIQAIVANDGVLIRNGLARGERAQSRCAAGLKDVISIDEADKVARNNLKPSITRSRYTGMVNPDVSKPRICNIGQHVHDGHVVPVVHDD